MASGIPHDPKLHSEVLATIKSGMSQSEAILILCH